MMPLCNIKIYNKDYILYLCKNVHVLFIPTFPCIVKEKHILRLFEKIVLSANTHMNYVSEDSCPFKSCYVQKIKARQLAYQHSVTACTAAIIFILSTDLSTN